MKVRELENILYSRHYDICPAIVYDKATDIDLENGCSIDYAVANYGDRVIERITAEDNKLVLHLGKEN